MYNKNNWALSVKPKNYSGDENVSFSVKDIPLNDLKGALMKNNFSTIHWNGNRCGDNFVKAIGFMIDIDSGFKIEKALRRLKKFDYNYALITSKSHSDTHHKYHIIMPSQFPIYSVDAYRTLEKDVVEKLFPESDQVVKDAGRFFYGSPEDADFKFNQNGINYPIIDENIWDRRLPILDADGKVVDLEGIGHTKIRCPFHEDNNSSAFLDYSKKSKNHYISCSACNQTFWMRKDEIPLEDRCDPFWSIGQNIIETGILRGKFFMENVGEKKFYTLSENESKKEKAVAYRYLVQNKHISHLTQVNYMGSVDSDKDRSDVILDDGIINVHVAPIAVKKKDNPFIEKYLEDSFGVYKDFIKQ